MKLPIQRLDDPTRFNCSPSVRIAAMLCDGMDATYFLKSRTAFIRAFYATGVQSFDAIKLQIEDGHPPFDNPPYSEDPEPPYLEEWMDAEASVEVLGLASISMLSDSLKLYLNTLSE